MRISTFRYIFWLLAVAQPLAVLATHQVGGQLEMRAVGDVPGHFHITVTNYLEDGTRGAASQGTSGTVGIYRVRDNTLMYSFTVRQTGGREKVIYANEFCAAQRNLNFIVLTYEADIQLSPNTYNDEQGYYMSYQTRNRNVSINNVSTPDQTGFTFYLEFPSLLKNGLYFQNSSPHFSPINGEYICLGAPFTFPFGGTDPDGDQLRYSMATPLNQKGGNNVNGGGGGNQNSLSPAPYPELNWLPGFSATNAIPGSPTLQVDEQTGQLTVTATALGLYVFTVRVEEIRNGVKIGEVRRDFQFLVIDCPPQTVPDPVAKFQASPDQQAKTMCLGDSTLLQATVNADWNYQWRRDGINLSGATSSSLTVREPGEYMVVVSQKAACSKVGNSENLRVIVIGAAAKLFEAGHLCATTGSVQFTVKGDDDVTYQWYRNNQAMAGETADSLRTEQPGRYYVRLTYNTLGCKVNTDTANIQRSAAVQALIKSSTGQNRICPQDSLQLQGSGGSSYSWEIDGTTVGGSEQYVTSKPGTFVLTATDFFGCKGTSPPVAIIQLAPIVVTLDSIPDVCGPNNPVYTLVGSPSEGIFVGPGVMGDQFNPKDAGVGNHQITYTVKVAPECQGTVAIRTAIVAPIPTIELRDSLTTYTGNTFSLNPVYTGEPTQFQWESATFLDNPNAANPTITNIEKDITYTINVKNKSGCPVKDTIYIKVLARVWVPDAFSPNGDGMNDTWELPGIEAFPDAIVTVFNRWGEIVYSSEKGYKNPFDGTLNGTSLPAGLYAYAVRTVPEKPILRGSLMLVR
ncbi:gliding motility-associated C-terminal domain-containing protein [Spirosoma sp. BT702]|uniref:Gliding motility-associated C-terminal domain-containing protein n=1 Tax=Spirosoma profusum TaxID=2771354 RepID=A0A926XY74_9BACT|nr:gliding motility-associated C-terminal domain-containing protein [Spirosoma profusum]MBD2703043.1 gliding motility-associated C-terminal domain-containing protein [Spirosoma profusum]